MKFCPVVPEICHGQVQVPKKERIIIIIIRNGAGFKGGGGYYRILWES
jgi:hypothetical protein